MFGAYISIGNIKIYVVHPDGGNSYAVSYKLQKIIEKFSSENKPNILLCGHFHNPAIIPQYRNIYAIQLPSMQAQTPYMKRKSLASECAVIILEITPDKKGIANIKCEYIPFFNVIQGDY